jgi:hypothetical protein
MASRGSPFPFFVGCGRSGTTLVRAMFDSHPDMAIPFESHFIVSLARRQPVFETDAGFATGPFLDELCRQWGFRRWGLARDQLQEAFRSPPSDYADAVRRSFALYADVHGKPRYADKTPMYVMNIPFLANLFPESRFVQVVRDGRDVALSLAEVRWFWPNDVAAAAQYWASSVETGRRAGRWLGPSRYQEVRYEDLLEDPAAALQPLCDFLGLNFDEAMLHHADHAQDVVASVPNPQEQTHILLPPTKGLRDWRSQMSREDLSCFETLAGEVLVASGYRLSRSAP